MAKQVSVTIVGPGSLGTTLARALHEAGVRVEAIVHRGGESGRRAKKLAAKVGATAVEFETWLQGLQNFVPPGRAKAPVPTPMPVPTLVWLCVGDSAIFATAAEMAKNPAWKRKTVFHSSGALSSDELEPLRKRDAKVASVHPMMTFVRSATPSMKGIPFALEGDRASIATARGVVKRLGGESFVIAKEDKPLYHALGALVSPLIIAQMAAAERIGRELGLKPQRTRKIAAPILEQTVRNYIEHGPASAFSGPIVRGDAETVRKNMAALKRVRGVAEIYRALAKVAIEELPSKDAKGIGKVLNKIR
jgi:predicted short-subunit dehydrogenase-like oxidoreductase (DUF2520 family)